MFPGPYHTVVTAPHTRLFRFLSLHIVFYHLTGSVPTEELKSIKRQVFRGTKGSDGAAAPVGLSEGNNDLPSIS